MLSEQESVRAEQRKADMFDNYTYLSGELRHFAYRKSSEQATWQDALKQQHRVDSEYRLDQLTPNRLLANISDALHFQFGHWRRTHQQASAGLTHITSRN